MGPFNIVQPLIETLIVQGNAQTSQAEQKQQNNPKE